MPRVIGATSIPPDQMMRVAEDIKAECGGKLHVLVATHRHKDHISGFATAEDGSGTGDVIAALRPDVVIQPWTEEPGALDPKVPGGGAKRGKKSVAAPRAGPQEAQSLNALHVASLLGMHETAEALLAEVRHLTDGNRFAQRLDDSVAGQITLLANDNGLPNRSAVENLAGMTADRKGAKNHYVNHGYALNLSKLLPGVKVHVLGPPTLEQHAQIARQRSSDKEEFWMLQAAAQKFWGMQAATSDLVRELASGGELFTDAKIYKKFFPLARQVVHQATPRDARLTDAVPRPGTG